MKSTGICTCSPYALPGIIPEVRRHLVPETVIRLVELCWELEPGQIFKKCRCRELVEARYMVMFLLYRYERKSLNKIGAIVRKDHTTVLHGIGLIQNQIQINREMRLRFINLCHRLQIDGYSINEMIKGREIV